MINYTKRLDVALMRASWAHQNNANEKKRYRKGTDIPFVIHPFAVMIIASNYTNDEDILIACLMHDILEDVDSATYDESKMREDFGDRVVEIVKGVTKDISLTSWHDRGKAYLKHLEFEASNESIIVCASDKMHNIMTILSDYESIGPDLWSRFSAGRKDQQWWYRSVLDVIKKRLPEISFLADFEKKVIELEAL